MQTENEHKDVKGLFGQIKADLTGYVDNKLSYFKLKTYEKISVTGSLVGYGVLLGILAFCLVLTALLALGFLLSELVHSYAGGFGLLIVVVLLVIGICIICKKAIRRTFMNLTISLIKKVEEDEE